MRTKTSLLTTAEVAALLNVSRQTVYRLVHRGVLPRPIKVGRMSRWAEADLEPVLNGKRRLDRPHRPGEQRPA